MATTSRTRVRPVGTPGGRPQTDPLHAARRHREDAFARIRSFTKTTAVTSVAAVAGLAVYFSQARPGHSSAPVASSGAPSSTGSSPTPGGGSSPASGSRRDGLRGRIRRAHRPVVGPGAVAAARAGDQRLQLSAPETLSRPPGATAYRATRWSTRIDLLVTERSALVGAVELLHRELDVVEAVASRFRPDSELNLLHRAFARAGGEPVPVSPLLAEAIAIGLRAGALTGGAVDITVGAALVRLGYDRDLSLLAAGVDGCVPEPRPLPGWRCVTLDRSEGTVAAPPGVIIDLGATAKAWAADRAVQSIGSTFGCGVLVSLGGDLAVSGAPDGGFVVGIADVCGADEAAVAVAITSGGLASSGIGRRTWNLGGDRVHHLVDPSTGLPVDSPWRTVTVAAASCVDANTASTAAMVTGEQAVAWLDGNGLPSRMERHDGSVVTVSGWPCAGRRGRPVTAMPVLLATSNGTALWYLTRASGVVALLLLTGSVVLGIVASVGWATQRWPRFLSQNIHRNLSLLCLGFVAVHIVSTVGDGYVPIGLADAVVPFRSPYRPLWVGLGALSFDLLLAVLVTSALRHRIGFRSWRFVHWLAYLCWPIAVLHGLGTGSDTSLGPVLAVDAVCTVAVLAAVSLRLVTGRTFGARPRLVAAAGAVAVTVALGAFAALGPLRPGWSHRSGTSPRTPRPDRRHGQPGRVPSGGFAGRRRGDIDHGRTGCLR